MSTSSEESDIEYMELNTAEIAAVLTCQICHGIYNDATAITECLHTFCRQCIYRKLSEVGARRCPQCNVYLGPAPLDRLKRHQFCNDLKKLVFPKQGGLDGSSSSATNPTQVAPEPPVAPPASPEPGVVIPSEPNMEAVEINGVKSSTETEASTVDDSSYSSEGIMEEDEEEEMDSGDEFSSYSTSSETSNNPRE